MEKNKAAYKLQGLPPLYYINLDAMPERDEYIKNHLDYWEVEDYTRISGNDGRYKDLSLIIKGKYPENMNSSEIGCTTSHLKAIKYWMETSDSPCAIIAEDDLDLSVVFYWNFSWKDVYSLIPYDYDVLQLAIISNGTLYTRLHKRFANDFSTAAYMITRHHAKKLLKFHTIGDKYQLDQGAKPRAVADDLIYNSGNTYSIPLWLYKIALGSSINPEHVDLLHKNNYTGLLEFWQGNGAKLDIRKMMDYDPNLINTTTNQGYTKIHHQIFK